MSVRDGGQSNPQTLPTESSRALSGNARAPKLPSLLGHGHEEKFPSFSSAPRAAPMREHPRLYLGEQDAAEGVGDGSVDAHHVELQDTILLAHHVHTELLRRGQAGCHHSVPQAGTPQTPRGRHPAAPCPPPRSAAGPRRRRSRGSCRGSRCCAPEGRHSP